MFFSTFHLSGLLLAPCSSLLVESRRPISERRIAPILIVFVFCPAAKPHPSRQRSSEAQPKPRWPLMLVNWWCFRSNPLPSQRLAASLENVCGQNRANSATNFFYGFLRDAGILISGSISSSVHRPPQVPGLGGRLAVLPLTIDGDGPFDFVVSTGAHPGEKAEQSPLAPKYNYFNPKNLFCLIAFFFCLHRTSRVCGFF